jgi:hypothetical protein
MQSDKTTGGGAGPLRMAERLLPSSHHVGKASVCDSLPLRIHGRKAVSKNPIPGSGQSLLSTHDPKRS